MGLASATVVTTYVLALAKGDAPALPMISDTFVRAPESYVSRVGVVTVSAALQLIVWFLHAYLRRFAAPTSSWRVFAFAHSLAGALAALALGVVGAISDVEDLAAHFTSATIFFFAVIAWQIGYTVQLAFHPVAAARASVIQSHLRVRRRGGARALLLARRFVAVLSSRRRASGSSQPPWEPPLDRSRANSTARRRARREGRGWNWEACGRVRNWVIRRCSTCSCPSKTRNARIAAGGSTRLWR